MNKQLKSDLLLLFVTVIWGAGFPVIKMGLASVPPFWFISIRFILAAVVMALLFYKQLHLFSKSLVKPCIMLSFLLFMTFATGIAGLKYTTASSASFFSGLAVLFAPFFARIVNKNPIKRSVFGSVCLATMGLYLLSSSSGKLSFHSGDWLCLASSAFFAMQIVFTGKYVEDHDPALLTLGQIVFVSIWGTLAGLIFEPFPVGITLTGMFSLSFTALLGTALAFFIQSRAQQHSPASHVAIVYSMEPVFGALLSFLVLGEMIGLRGLAGGILIFCGLILAELK